MGAAGQIGPENAVAHARHRHEVPLREPSRDRSPIRDRRAQVALALEDEHRHVRQRTGTDSRAARLRRPAEAERRRPEVGRPKAERAGRAARQRAAGRGELGRALRERSVRIPGERPVVAHGRGEHPHAEVLRRGDRALAVELNEPEKRA